MLLTLLFSPIVNSILRPATMTLPEVGERVVVRMDSVVVLPAPFGPRREKNSPASTVNEMSSRALSAADAYRLMRCSTSIITVIFLVWM